MMLTKEQLLSIYQKLIENENLLKIPTNKYYFSIELAY